MTRPANIIPINEAAQVRTQCVLLAVVAVVSFRSIPRILSILRPDQWKPHFTSTINWTLRFGLSLLRGVERVDTPWVAIVDETIDVAVQKALVVLRVPLSALATRGSAITLEDAQCIGISVADTWNGETVSAYLQHPFLLFFFSIDQKNLIYSSTCTMDTALHLHNKLDVAIWPGPIASSRAN